MTASSTSFPLRRLRWTVAGLLFGVLAQASCQVTLNEMSSASWERAVHYDATGQARMGSGPHWFQPSFQPQAWWTSGSLPFKFGTATQDNALEDAMKYKTPTLYLRGNFTITTNQANDTGVIAITTSTYDGFVIYLNGREAARRNAGATGTWVFHDQTSYLPRAITSETIELGPANQWLVAGQNLLAVVAMNDTITGEQFYDGHDPSLNEFRFTATMALDGTNIPLTGSNASWKYFPGICEPSGGLYEAMDFIAPVLPPEFVDWVELKNTSNAAVDMNGWSLSDAMAVPRKWVFPAGAIVPAAGRLIVACSGRNLTTLTGNQYYHTNFSLQDSGEFVGLYNASGVLVSHFSQIPKQEARYTWGFAADGGATPQFLAQATPGSVNAAAAFVSRAKNPTTTVESGHQVASLVVPFSSATPGATLRYTTDGSDPTESSPVVPGAGIPAFPALPGGTGQLLRELYVNQPGGTSLSSINFTATPTKAMLQSSAETPDYYGTRVGERLRGLLRAPATGNYRFYITAENRAKFKLSLTASPSGLTEICKANDDAIRRHWEADPEQESASIALTAGQQCYFEATTYDSTKSAIALGWKRPGQSGIELLDPSHLTQPTSLPQNVQPLGPTRAVCLKVRAFAAGMLPSSITTRSYVLGMPQAMQDLPSVFLSGDPEQTFYGANGIFAVSGGHWDFAEDDEPRWQPIDDGHDYFMPLVFGQAFERPSVVEFLLPNNTLAGRTGAGVRFSGSAFSRPHYYLWSLQHSPWYGDWHNKPQVNLFFRGALGDKQFEAKDLLPNSPVSSWDSFRLRAGRAKDNYTLVYDEHVRRTFNAMGQPTVQGRPVNVFVNGQMKALYLLVERARSEWLQEYYKTNTEFLVVSSGTLESGNEATLQAMEQTLKDTDCTTQAGYSVFQNLWNPTNVADYFLLNSYIASGDWIYNSGGDGNNWMFLDTRPGGKWHFSVWDAESSYGAEEYTASSDFTTTVLLNPALEIEDENSMLRLVFRRACQNPEFRLLFADRVQKALFNNGPLAAGTLNATMDAVNNALAPAQLAYTASTPDLAEARAWFNQRQAPLLAEFTTLGLWPTTHAPGISQLGGTVATNSLITLTNTNPGGILYFTTDGTDPRAPGGTVAPGAHTYSTGFPILRPTIVRSRVLHNTVWSPEINLLFAPPVPQVVFSEIHYNPDGADDLTEFIELHNTGTATAYLDQARFTAGVEFTFPNTAIAPGQRIVIVGNPVAFAQAFPSVSIAGVFTGNLDNSGEHLQLVDAVGAVIADLRYGDDAVVGWPTLADGKGPSLVLRADPNLTALPLADPARWRVSTTPGGSPGRVDTLPPPTRAAALVDADRDGSPALLEFVFGTHDFLAASRQQLDIRVDLENELVTVEAVRLVASETVALTAFRSQNLTQWSPLPEPEKTVIDLEHELLHWQFPTTTKEYIRLRAIAP